MSTGTHQVFDLTASTYDTERARLVPGFDRLYRWALELIPAGAQRIVDLGAGTGLLTAMLRARFPKAAVHLVDASEPMLAQARARLAGDSSVTFEVADYLVAPLGEGWDAAVSALSIHHLPDAGKQALFARVCRCLRPGGVFVNAEQVLGPTPALEARYRARWLEEVRALGATEEQIAASLFRQEADRCAPVEDQLTWMREAGFLDADCWYKEGRFAVLAGARP